MKKGFWTIKCLATLLVAVGAVLATTNSCHAGGVYLNFYYYSWDDDFSTPLYSPDAINSVGTFTFAVNAYSYAGFGSEEIDNLGPNNPAIIIAGTEHIYEGGPDNGAQAFLTNAPYWQAANSNRVVLIINEGYPRPNINLYVLQVPQPISSASVPH